MRIDPKDFRLDANERRVLVNALGPRIDKLTADIERKRKLSGAWKDRQRLEIESLENERARAEDLLGALR